MSTVQEAAINLIRSLPNDCTLDDIHYHLYVREKVDRGLAAIGAGKVVPHEEAVRRIAERANGR